MADPKITESKRALFERIVCSAYAASERSIVMDKLLVADQSALCYDQHGPVGAYILCGTRGRSYFLEAFQLIW